MNAADTGTRVPSPKDFPSASDIARFLEVFQALDSFESGQRMMRGYGVFDPATTELPDPATVRTIAWLRGLAAGETASPAGMSLASPSGAA